MLKYGVTAIQNKPSLLKEMDLAEIIDKRAHTSIGYFIPSKYEKYMRSVFEKIKKDEKTEKLNRLKKHQDIEFLELGVDDGL